MGTLRGVADMINGGVSLDAPMVWNAWPEDLPLLIYHGEDDVICDPKTSERFVRNARAKDKQFKLFNVSYRVSLMNMEGSFSHDSERLS